MSDKTTINNLPSGAFESGNPVFDAVVHILAANAASGKIDWCKENYTRSLHRVLNEIYLAEPAIPMRRTMAHYDLAISVDGSGQLRNSFFGIHPDHPNNQSKTNGEE